jgi:hypothetical protein
MAQPELSDAKIYDQVSIDIRATDEITFKLMGIVRLVSGAGLLAIFLAREPPLLILLSVFASAITIGLFRWELRNIQNCRWLIKYADELERSAFEREGQIRSYVSQPDPPQKIGKTEAEKFIYAVTIATWLVVPVVLLPSNEIGRWLWSLYIPISAVIALATVISLFAGVEAEPKQSVQKKAD